METNGAEPAQAQEPGTRRDRIQALGEVARRLPDAHKVVNRLHTTWKTLVSSTTPVWKKVLVALEAARLTWETRKQKRDEPVSGLRRE